MAAKPTSIPTADTFLDNLVKRSENLDNRASEIFSQLHSISVRLFSADPENAEGRPGTPIQDGKLHKIEYCIDSLSQKIENIGSILNQLDLKI